MLRTKEMPDRTFGVELEIVGLDEYDAIRALKRAGLAVADNDGDSGYCSREDCRRDRYYDEYGDDAPDFEEADNYEAHSEWVVKEDGSVSGFNGSCEVVSPILSGAQGLAELRKACAALLAAGATVNPTCGLHVHLGAKDLTLDEIKAVFRRYAKHEKTIDGVMHRSRRDRGNGYAGSLVPYVERLNSCYSEDSLARFNRYLKLNLSSLGKYGTLEFRHHNGAVKPDTVANWVLFLLNFVERTRLMVANPTRKIRDCNPFIGLDLDTRKFYHNRLAMERNGTVLRTMAWG